MDTNNPLSENIRIDLLKVRQKISQLYPPNSIGRKKIVRWEKEREAAKLEAALNMFPKTVADNLVSVNQSHMKQVSKTIAYHIGFSAIIISGWIPLFLQLHWASFLLPLALSWHIAEIVLLSRDWMHHRDAIRDVNATQQELEKKKIALEKELNDE